MKKRILGRTGLAVSELSLGELFVSSLGADFEQSKQAGRLWAKTGPLAA